MNRTNTPRTITVQDVSSRCNTLILRLTNPANRAARSEAKAIVNSARKDVDARFHELVKKHVMDENKNVNPALMNTLQASENPEQFLEAFIISLYGKAVEKEEAIALQLLNDEEKIRLRKLNSNDKEYKHDDKGYKHDDREYKHNGNASCKHDDKEYKDKR